MPDRQKSNKTGGSNNPVPVEAGPIFPIVGMGLSDEEYSAIGQTQIHWATAELLIGPAIHALNQAEGLPINKLVDRLTTGVKHQLLREKCIESKLSGRLIPYLEEYEYAVRTYRENRNIYAHGMYAANTEGGFFFTLKGQRLERKMIYRVLEQGKYALFFAYWLTQIPFDPPGPQSWPERPD